MARSYPKFLHQVVTGTKSEGEFVIHLLQPRLLFQVHRSNGSIDLALLDEVNDPSLIKEAEAILFRAKQWLISKESH